MGSLGTFDGELFRAVATHGFPEQFANQLHQPFRPHRYMRPLVNGARLVVEPDIQALISDDHAIHGAVEAGARTALVVPLRKAGALVGYISAFRREVRPFSGTEITLLETFAAQAVIAMENARLLQELSEALDEQTATAEILQVINASQGDLTPVFVAMIDKTQRLTQSEFSSLMIYDGSLFHLFSGNEWQPDTLSPEPGAALAELLEGVPFVHIPDVVDTDAYRARIPSRVLLVEGFGARTTLWVPLRKDGALLGVLISHRRVVRPFNDRQIALLQTFAAQAVIAMENARLINEQREALEQQTATAEVLQVINASPGDLAPVFTTMLQKALDLCEAAFGGLFVRDGERFYAAATAGLSPEFSAFIRKPFVPAPDSTFRRAIRGESIIHISDVSQVSIASNPQRKALVEQGGARTQLQIALSKDNVVLGAFNIFRQEVRPFSIKQIALLKNFAEQAVVAMENARLRNELREALEQQTATAEVLQVIGCWTNCVRVKSNFASRSRIWATAWRYSTRPAISWPQTDGFSTCSMCPMT